MLVLILLLWVHGIWIYKPTIPYLLTLNFPKCVAVICAHPNGNSTEHYINAKETRRHSMAVYLVFSVCAQHYYLQNCSQSAVQRMVTERGDSAPENGVRQTIERTNRTEWNGGGVGGWVVVYGALHPLGYGMAKQLINHIHWGHVLLKTTCSQPTPVNRHQHKRPIARCMAMTSIFVVAM